MPTVRQIEYFLTVARYGGLSHASKVLFIAQPALTRQIMMLEEELGFPLFTREPRGMVLTPAGLTYQRRVSAVPDILAAAGEEGRQVSAGEAGTVRLLHTSTVPVKCFIPAIRSFMQDYPGVRIELNRASSESQMNAVANGEADLGIFRPPVLRRSQGTIFRELRPERLWVAMHSSHRLSRQESLHVHELENEPFVSAIHREHGGLAKVVTDLCLKNGFIPKIAQITSPKTAMLDLVGYGYGIAIVPEGMALLEFSNVSFIPLQDRNAVSARALLLPVNVSNTAENIARYISEIF